MDPVDTLVNEHVLIRQYLDNMAIAAEYIHKGKGPSRAFFHKALDFARSFADELHHFKEEYVLFERLAQKKRGLDAQITTLRHQHERGRELLAAIEAALAGYEAKAPRETADLLEAMAAHISLLRHHIHIEDYVFFPLAREVLSEGDMTEISARFAEERARHDADAFAKGHKNVVDMGSILSDLGS